MHKVHNIIIVFFQREVIYYKSLNSIQFIKKKYIVKIHQTHCIQLRIVMTQCLWHFVQSVIIFISK